ncbi:CpaE family protein [Methylobacterium sp. J-076]|uniref:AAA family ATPase n=1 Tax=Methylobacterium sp. J-076 TaxID=2836655 RepID=UPI001FBBEA15|nr:AAA family ATPase [Methylobacterium sp. J-076]MCJ2013494.1 AAA family ATPase [Methylobacterium sp. J-076]
MAEQSETAERVIAPVPRITIQAFCEVSETAAMIEAAAQDRRLQRARVKVRMGGGAAAIEAFRHAPTPNVIVLEVQGARSKPLECLDALAEVCDEGTRVLVIGHLNDVTLYRQLLQRGVSDYLMAPVDPLTLIASISEMFTAAGVRPIGRSIAVFGVRGGIGASTVAHNLAWSVARGQGVPTVIADLDIAFGTASLNFNQDPPQGIAEAVFAPERLDAALVERLLSKCSDNLSLLSAPASLDRTIDLSEPAFDVLIEHLRSSVPCLVLDVPHQWNAWTKRVLSAADEILVVAGPDLASLRNAKNLLGALKHGRPNDALPRVLLNGTGMPKRPEIAAAEFAKALDVPLAATIPFDPSLFGTAANNGQMIAEVQPGSKLADLFNDLAASAIGRVETRHKSGASLLEPLLAKLAARRKAS